MLMTESNQIHTRRGRLFLSLMTWLSLAGIVSPAKLPSLFASPLHLIIGFFAAVLYIPNSLAIVMMPFALETQTQNRKEKRIMKS